MRQLLNTLFITSEDIYAALEGENIVLKRDGKDSLQFYNVALYSPTPHGVGGLKCSDCQAGIPNRCPTPHGVGGLKWNALLAAGKRQKSHPSRGGWIEIIALAIVKFIRGCPTPHGVGGLKSLCHALLVSASAVPPLTGWVD